MSKQDRIDALDAFSGMISETYFKPEYLDLSIPANRQKLSDEAALYNYAAVLVKKIAQPKEGNSDWAEG